MKIFRAALAASLAWAIYAALATERRHRAEWIDFEQPAIEVGDPPYRSAAVRPRLARAPWLVRLTAFACLWIGQAVMIVMFVPAILFWRGGGIAIGTIESTAPWRHSTIAHDLGPLLMQRHRRALPVATAVVHMLRIVAGALAVFAAFGLMGVASSEPAWWIMFGYAASAALLAGLVSFLTRRHSARSSESLQTNSERSSRSVSSSALATAVVSPSRDVRAGSGCRVGLPGPTSEAAHVRRARSATRSTTSDAGTVPRRLEERASADEPVLYSDEVDVHLNPKIGRDWMLRGHQRRIVTPGKNQKFYLAGALDVRTGRLHTTGAEKKNAALFCQLLWLLASNYRRARRVHLVVDNYGIHSAHLTRGRARHPPQTRRPPLPAALLPKC
jgi:hypothetical protein